MPSNSIVFDLFYTAHSPLSNYYQNQIYAGCLTAVLLSIQVSSDVTMCRRVKDSGRFKECALKVNATDLSKRREALT
jgi:hypothetical protein